jgi:iron complex outermembrane receptor protein
MKKGFNFSFFLLSLGCFTLVNASDIIDIGTLLEDVSKDIQASKLNVDDTPSVISVLKHEELQLLGIKTLFEALSILPGVETSINQIGTKKVIIRGHDNPNNFTFDKAKLLVDGVSIEMGIFGNSSFYLNLPIDVIERIEILRGPGSALYGAGALNGVINVVTAQSSQSGDGLFFGGGSDGYLMGGLRKHYDLGSDTHLYTDMYYQKHDRMIDVDESYGMSDLLYDPQTGDVHAFERDPQSVEALNDYALSLALKHKQFSFQTRLKEDKNGNYYGWDEKIEEFTTNRNKQRYFFAELAYEDAISNDTHFISKLGYSYFDMSIDAQDYYRIQEDPRVSLPYHFSIKEREERFTFKSELRSEAYDSHTIVGGIALESFQELDNSIEDDLSPYGKRALFEEGIERNLISAYVRDSIDISSTLGALIALRFDYYSKEEKLYPSGQLGLLFTPAEQWNFKLNYGHAFRIPSWVEQYSIEYGEGDGTRAGNPDLEAETSDTFEAVAIYRVGNQHHLQANVYYSIIDQVLDIDDTSEPGGYDNRESRASYGGEIAYTFIPYLQDQLHLNASYNETEYVTSGLAIEQSMPGVAKMMLKAYYIHYLSSALSVSALLKHIGERPRHQDSDSRDENNPLDPYSTLDLTMNYLSSYHWDLQFSVKNIADARVTYPSYYSRHDGGNIRQGRNVLVQGTYRF